MAGPGCGGEMGYDYGDAGARCHGEPGGNSAWHIRRTKILLPLMEAGHAFFGKLIVPYQLTLTNRHVMILYAPGYGAEKREQESRHTNPRVGLTECQRNPER